MSLTRQGDAIANRLTDTGILLFDHVSENMAKFLLHKMARHMEKTFEDDGIEWVDQQVDVKFENIAKFLKIHSDTTKQIQAGMEASNNLAAVANSKINTIQMICNKQQELHEYLFKLHHCVSKDFEDIQELVVNQFKEMTDDIRKCKNDEEINTGVQKTGTQWRRCLYNYFSWTTTSRTR